MFKFITLQNKKQRMMVRQAVLKGKDPFKLLEDVESIDKMGTHCFHILRLESLKLNKSIIYKFDLSSCNNLCWLITLHIKLIFLVAEFDPSLPPKLNEKVLRDKRKKLKETLERVLKLYVIFFFTFIVSICRQFKTFFKKNRVWRQCVNEINCKFKI